MQATEVKVGTVPEHECDDPKWEYPRVRVSGGRVLEVWVCATCEYAFRRERTI